MSHRILTAIALTAVALLPLAAVASEGGAHGEYWKQPQIRLSNERSLQRGAQLFTNYCMGCHTAKYQRWQHVADDLDIPEKVVEQNLIWMTGPKGKRKQIGSLMTNAMTEQYGINAFGKAPPDLSLKARSRGPAWLYNYLRTFYLDESSKTGANNAVLKGASMPHVLWSLQGWQKPVYAEEGHGEGKTIKSFELVKKGSMSPKEFDRAMNDLVNFLVYLGEPARMDRAQVGIWVLLFLLAFFGCAFVLKKEYWKDVH